MGGPPNQPKSRVGHRPLRGSQLCLTDWSARSSDGAAVGRSSDGAVARASLPQGAGQDGEHGRQGGIKERSGYREDGKTVQRGGDSCKRVPGEQVLQGRVGKVAVRAVRPED